LRKRIAGGGEKLIENENSSKGKGAGTIRGGESVKVHCQKASTPNYTKEEKYPL